jgi:diguanylate cyclase
MAHAGSGQHVGTVTYKPARYRAPRRRGHRIDHQLNSKAASGLSDFERRLVLERPSSWTPAPESFPLNLQVMRLRTELATFKDTARDAEEEVRRLTQRNLRLSRSIRRLTEREANACRLAYHDPLTGLPNRRLLLDRFDQAIALGNRQQRKVALLLLDLDGFKLINDRLGHAAGDIVIQAVGQRLIDCIRGADTACRYGGDEFIVMLTEIMSQQAAVDVARKIGARLAAPHFVDGIPVTVTASIGIAIFPDDGVNWREVIRQADCDMYRAKRSRARTAPSQLLLHLASRVDS